MGIFDNLSSSRRKPRPVGQRLERGLEDDVRSRRRNHWLKAGILLVLVALTVAIFPREEIYRYTVEVGQEWQRETVVAPFDFPIYKDEETLAEERRQVRFDHPPIFTEVPDALERMDSNRVMVEAQLEAIFEAYENYRFNRSRGRVELAASDSSRYMEYRRNAWPKLTPEQWQILLQDYIERVPGLATSSREPREGPLMAEELLADAYNVGVELINLGVLNVPRDSILTDRFRVRDEETVSIVTRYKKNHFGLNEAYTSYAPTQFRGFYPDRPELVNIANAFFRVIFVPNYVFQRADTYDEWREAQRGILDTYGKVSQGEIIVRTGDIVDEATKRKLTSLETFMEDRTGATFTWRQVLGQVLLTLITYFIFFLYLYLLRKQIFEDNRQVLLIALLFAGIIGLFALAMQWQAVVMYGVPVAIASVLLTVIYDSRVGLFGTITLAILGALLLNYDFLFAYATIFAGSLAVFSVRDIKNRGQIIVSAAIVFVGYVLVFGASWLFSGTTTDLLLRHITMAGAGAFLMLASYLLLWVFERTFDITTDLTLLELSNTNRPLLKELSLRAPGTFNHSLQVANLAEAAADNIGANALLARVGALYHDIGKMLKPEYFVENQRPGDNPHDQLKPRMSALIIASHVKEGLEMGRQYRLPKRVLDFIPMHHGTTRIEYFYRKACEQQGEGAEVQDTEFRYPGPRPTSKETGIMMLADSVEAASRSLTEPTHKRLETLVDMIFKARIEDNQLNNTDLTFQDLSRIKETFLSVLLGIYHVRVKYPGQDEEKARKPFDTRTDEPEPAASAPEEEEDEEEEEMKELPGPEGRAMKETDGAEQNGAASEPKLQPGEGDGEMPIEEPDSDRPSS